MAEQMVVQMAVSSVASRAEQTVDKMALWTAEPLGQMMAGKTVALSDALRADVKEHLTVGCLAAPKEH